MSSSLPVLVSDDDFFIEDLSELSLADREGYVEEIENRTRQLSNLSSYYADLLAEEEDSGKRRDLRDKIRGVSEVKKAYEQERVRVERSHVGALYKDTVVPLRKEVWTLENKHFRAQVVLLTSTLFCIVLIIVIFAFGAFSFSALADGKPVEGLDQTAIHGTAEQLAPGAYEYFANATANAEAYQQALEDASQ